MERIQSAIEKARKARTTVAGTEDAPEQKSRENGRSAPVAEPPVPETGPGGDPDRDALWKSVPLFKTDIRRMNRNRILAYKPGKESSAYDVMRTSLLQQMRKNDWTRVAITSSGAGSGKTMTSLNLAFSLARQSDLRVMVVELDMRRPSIARMLGIREPVQFSQVLEGKAAPEDHLLRYGANLIFAVNQASARHTAELLQGSKAAGILDAVEAAYRPDIIVIDTPPLLASDDTLAFLDQVDAALLLIEAERTTPAEVERCEHEMTARTNLLGVVLNKCRYLDRTESYGYYYGN